MPSLADRRGNEDDAAPEQQPEAGEDEKHSPGKCQRQPRSQHTPIVRPPRPFRKRSGSVPARAAERRGAEELLEELFGEEK
jgi:hypothetical protein